MGVRTWADARAALKEISTTRTDAGGPPHTRGEGCRHRFGSTTPSRAQLTKGPTATAPNRYRLREFCEASHSHSLDPSPNLRVRSPGHPGTCRDCCDHTCASTTRRNMTVPFRCQGLEKQPRHQLRGSILGWNLLAARNRWSAGRRSAARVRPGRSTLSRRVRFHRGLHVRQVALRPRGIHFGGPAEQLVGKLRVGPFAAADSQSAAPFADVSANVPWPRADRQCQPRVVISFHGVRHSPISSHRRWKAVGSNADGSGARSPVTGSHRPRGVVDFSAL
jgi:hypothetical protein